jgi:hypothetical protein
MRRLIAARFIAPVTGAFDSARHDGLDSPVRERWPRGICAAAARHIGRFSPTEIFSFLVASMQVKTSFLTKETIF